MCDLNYGPVVLDVDLKRRSVLVKDKGTAFITDNFEGRWVRAEFSKSGLVLFSRTNRCGTEGYIAQGMFAEGGAIKIKDGRAAAEVTLENGASKVIFLRNGCMADYRRHASEHGSRRGLETPLGL